jgi:amidophosphoribosyltransferase
MPSATELIAHGRSDDEVGELIGADWIIYQDIEDLVKSTQGGDSSVAQFDCSVFDGQYVTGDVDDSYLDSIEAKRNDAAKQQNETVVSNETNDMHNRL